MRALLSLVAIGSLAAGACGDSDADLAFIDQPAQGEIGGTAWVMADGHADDNSDGSLDLELTLPQSQTGCDIFIGTGDVVLFGLPAATPGVYPLTTGLPGQTVTLYDDDSGTNYIATRGQVEILTVTTLEVTGRIAVAYDADNYVNGNFTIAHCP